MAKKPAKQPVRQQPGGPVVGLRPAPPRKAPAPPVRQQPGGPIRTVAPAPKKKPKKPVKRRLALGEAVACCAAEALAASLRLTGWRVGDDDVLALYERTASGPDEGASVEETLGAAQRYGLAGFRPEPSLVDAARLLGSLGSGAPLILGVGLPEGPHAVCVGPDGAWWSWGEPYDPATWPDAVIEEAWQVDWWASR